MSAANEFSKMVPVNIPRKQDREKPSLWHLFAAEFRKVSVIRGYQAAMFFLLLLRRLLPPLLLATMVVGQTPTHNQCRPRNCAEAECYGAVSQSGPAWLYLTGNQRISGSCEVHEGGGWTVLQRRNEGKLDFDRGWLSYKRGFGKHGPAAEMWFGNENIYNMTGLLRKGVYLRIELKGTHTKQVGVAEYGDFKLFSEDQNYMMTFGQEIVRTMITEDSFKYSNKSMFGTSDNDRSSSRCAAVVNKKSGGWWWSDTADVICSSTNLNGIATGRSGWDKMVWLGFNAPSRLTSSKMLIRPMGYKPKQCVNPCKNGGICRHVYQTGVYRCSCPTGFFGVDCELTLKETVTSRAPTTTKASVITKYTKIMIVGTILAAIALAAIGIGVVVWLLHKHKAATSLDEQKNMDDKEEWKRTMGPTNILDMQKRGCDLSRTRVTDDDLSRTRITDADLSRTRVTEADLSRTRERGKCKVLAHKERGKCKVLARKERGKCKVLARKERGKCKVLARKEGGKCKVLAHKERGKCKVLARKERGKCKVLARKERGKCKVLARKEGGKCKVLARKEGGKCKVLAHKERGKCKVLARKEGGKCKGHVTARKAAAFASCLTLHAVARPSPGDSRELDVWSRGSSDVRRQPKRVSAKVDGGMTVTSLKASFYEISEHHVGVSGERRIVVWNADI
ncbi:hypothetical protein LSAT2_006101 [Lamellibrachia satsuma]|nr:hypothetical protein LSAT2_006101 [Lamellibrachia satsuma]